jgi:hypothetical protein
VPNANLLIDYYVLIGVDYYVLIGWGGAVLSVSVSEQSIFFFSLLAARLRLRLSLLPPNPPILSVCCPFLHSILHLSSIVYLCIVLGCVTYPIHLNYISEIVTVSVKY